MSDWMFIEHEQRSGLRRCQQGTQVLTSIGLFQVVDPSTSKNTPAPRAAIPRPRSVNVRTLTSNSTAPGHVARGYPEVRREQRLTSRHDHRQLGYESEAKEDHRHGQDANNEGGTPEVQERVPDRGAEGVEGTCKSVNMLGSRHLQ